MTCSRRFRQAGGHHLGSQRHTRLLLITNADELTVLPRAIRAVRESESLRGKNHSHREGDSH